MASNSAGFVRELQEYLRTVALFHGQSTALQITGVYDESTRRAVKSFQKDHNLPVTGDTDLNTWETLLLAHRQILHETALPRPLHLFPAGQFQLSSGSSGSLVAAMQMILQALGERYSNFPSVDLSASYDESTRLAVLFIQEKSDLIPTGVIDKATWNRIAMLYNFNANPPFDNQIHNK